MSLIVDQQKKIFDINVLKEGYLIYGRHRSWAEGIGGFIAAITEDRITVQYHPSIRNVTNHYYILASEVAEGEWDILASKDMVVIYEEKLKEQEDAI
mgnify:CR=1 FL=1